MKKSILSIQYGLIQSSYWMGFSILVGFSSPYLLAIGYNSAQIGTMIACAGLTSAVLQPIVAAFADRKGGYTLKRIILLGALGLLLASALLFWMHGNPLAAVGILYAAAVAVLQLLNSLINALGMSHASVNFGVCRGIASAFYAISSAVVGFLTDDLGTAIIPTVLFVLFGILTVSVLLFRSNSLPCAPAGQKSTGFFRRNPGFLQVLAACVCVYTSHILINNYVFQIVVSRGGNGGEMGIAVSLACAAELPAMIFFGYLLKKAKPAFWVTLAGLGFTLKAFFTLLAPGIPLLYAAQIFQMLGWGLFSVAIVYFVHKLVAAEDESKGQAYITVTYAIATVLGSFLGGIIIEQMGVNAMLITSTLFGALGMVIQLYAVRRMKK